MGFYINEASRRKQIKISERKLRVAITKVASSLDNILSRKTTEDDEVKVLRQFLEGLTDWMTQTYIRRELQSESIRFDLAEFIEGELSKHKKT